MLLRLDDLLMRNRRSRSLIPPYSPCGLTRCPCLSQACSACPTPHPSTTGTSFATPSGRPRRAVSTKNKDLDRYGDTPFRSETGFAPIRSHMAVAIKNVLIQSTFMSADEARSHATRAHAESAWQHCDAPQFSEKNIHDRTLHGTKMWASTYFVPRVQRVKEAWDTLSTNLRSTIRWCELLRL